MTESELELRRRDGDNWHLDKKVPVSLIIAMVAQIVAVVWAVADIKKDVELNKQSIEQLQAADKFLIEEGQRNLQTIQGHYARLEAKIDRLIERDANQHSK